MYHNALSELSSTQTPSRIDADDTVAAHGYARVHLRGPSRVRTNAHATHARRSRA
jgi:hypothetical protein